MFEMLPVVALIVLAVFMFGVASIRQANKRLDAELAKEDEERQARIDLMRAQAEAVRK